MRQYTTYTVAAMTINFFRCMAGTDITFVIILY